MCSQHAASRNLLLHALVLLPGASPCPTSSSQPAPAPRVAQVPVCSVIFSLVCGILALVFFLLFLAHHDRWEESGCTLLLTAASAAAGPGSLMLRSVHDPATLVCLGREEHAPQVTEDALASLLAAHPKAFSEAQAQLSFTPAGSAQRWGISLEVKGLALNATAGTATIQVRIYGSPPARPLRKWAVCEGAVEGGWHKLDMCVPLVNTLLGACHLSSCMPAPIPCRWRTGRRHQQPTLARSTRAPRRLRGSLARARRWASPCWCCAWMTRGWWWAWATEGRHAST